MPKEPLLITHRAETPHQAAIVFIHGFTGHPAKTWGQFARLLMIEPRLNGWAIVSYGYDTGLRVDIRRIWSADPPIDRLAAALITSATQSNLKPYKAFCFIAHSMGGLVLQRALLDSAPLVEKTSGAILFGTPSNGLVKAGFGRLLKPQLEQMARDSEFVADLRRRWQTQFPPERTPFRFRAVAGYNDEFVPPDSSLRAFEPSQTAMIPGDHLSIVKPQSSDDPSVHLVLDVLTGTPAIAGVANTARVACDLLSFQETVARLARHAERLDRKAAVELAMAYDALGGADEATRVLRLAAERDTDAKGALAGRYKRLWWTHREDADAEEAERLYGEAYADAVAAQRWDQAFYHGINLAFLAEAYRGDKAAAKDLARSTLAHCQAQREQAGEDKWLLATEGDAHLLMGELDEALARYRAMLRLPSPPNSREIGSVYQQAVHLLDQRDDALGLARLEAFFLENTL